MDLLILDDWGLQKITAAQRQDLMEVEDRHGRRSTLIARLPTEPTTLEATLIRGNPIAHFSCRRAYQER